VLEIPMSTAVASSLVVCGSGCLLSLASCCPVPLPRFDTRLLGGLVVQRAPRVIVSMESAKMLR
jgi:hypothetical protein